MNRYKIKQFVIFIDKINNILLNCVIKYLPLLVEECLFYNKLVLEECLVILLLIKIFHE